MGEPKATQPPDSGELYERSLAETGAVFVRAIEGRPVTRYGTPVVIGADRDPANPNKLIYRTGDVVMIPSDEAQRYRREYVRHIVDGDLALVSKPEGGAPRKETTTTGSTGAVAKGPPDAADESRRK